MNELLIYLIKSAVSLGTLYLIFWLFLSRDTFFTVNRFYLVSSIILSFILPLLQFNFFYDNSQTSYIVVLEAITITANKIENGINQNLDLYQIIFIVYLTGVTIFMLRFIFQLLQLMFLIRRYGVDEIKGLKFVKIDKKYSPFSYFNFVFINQELLLNKNSQSIIDHEVVHIKQKHTFDLIILELLTILQWFNPFIWLYKISLKSIHEYLADEGLLMTGTNKNKYQNLLLNHTVGLQINDLTNNFNQTLIKKRFIMMTKTKSKKRANMKLLLAVPAVAILTLCFALSFSSNATAQKTKKNQQDEVFQVVEKAPEFEGGQKALQEFLVSNIKYPVEARKKGISGTVYVRFIVEKNGTITDAKVIRGIGAGCDEEAVRVVSAMPKWIPGKEKGKKVRVQFTFPIKFSLR